MFKRLFSHFFFWAWVLWGAFLSPIWSLNIERWAESRDFDTKIDSATAHSPDVTLVSWMIGWVDYLTGDFLVGAAFVSGVILAVDAIRWLWVKISGRPTPKSLQGLSLDVYHAHKAMEHERNRLDKIYRSGRLNMQASHTASLENENKLRSVLYELKRHSIHVPEFSGRLHFKEAKISCDFLAVVAPYISKGQTQEARRHSKSFLQELKDEVS